MTSSSSSTVRFRFATMDGCGGNVPEGSTPFDVVTPEVRAFDAMLDAGSLTNGLGQPEPTGYRVTQLFQTTDAEGHPEGMYAKRQDVSDWTQIAVVIDAMLKYPMGHGYTVGITVMPLNVLEGSVKGTERVLTTF